MVLNTRSFQQPSVSHVNLSTTSQSSRIRGSESFPSSIFDMHLGDSTSRYYSSRSNWPDQTTNYYIQPNLKRCYVSSKTKYISNPFCCLEKEGPYFYSGSKNFNNKCPTKNRVDTKQFCHILVFRVIFHKKVYKTSRRATTTYNLRFI